MDDHMPATEADVDDDDDDDDDDDERGWDDDCNGDCDAVSIKGDDVGTN